MSKGFLTIAPVTETILNDEACQKQKVEIHDENIDDIIENPELKADKLQFAYKTGSQTDF